MPKQSEQSLLKKEWRRFLLDMREKLYASPAWRSQSGERLTQKIRFLLEKKSPQIVGAYSAFRSEFDPLPMLLEWKTQTPFAVTTSRRLALPLMMPEKTITFKQWDEGTPMRTHAFGMQEPQSGITLKPDLILIPCVGFGKGNIRLGYGGGYYDRSLVHMSPRPYLVGIAHQFSYLEELQAEPHDIALDLIVTDA